MMKKKPSARENSSSSTTAAREEESEWEMRPGGMLVQKRTTNTDVVTRNLRLRIAYGALRYEICVSSIATFGEVKKVLSGETGLEVDEQRLLYRGKERENGEYLDVCGVKDRSKVVLIQDPSSIERRFIQMRINAKIQTAHRAINNVAVQLDQLADQVSAIEKSISNGVKVPEVQITTLIEMLMRQAIKLESISAEGDASAQKNLQVFSIELYFAVEYIY
ncbi:BAG family molecular chaperone regulator 3 isoform A [Glycine soja]|uniref:BAG family molecular chaperone regulator 3 isoform A n=1 Tax=Glycine soja TaxID=3848 RepID=A0A445GRC9_GLYSO|nr:BAG family molecular chaperone regulator 3 isoform A [Glycine soja]